MNKTNSENVMSLVKESSSFSGIYRLTKTTFYLKKNKQQTSCFKDIVLFPTFLRLRCKVNFALVYFYY